MTNEPMTFENCVFRNNNRGVYACGRVTFDGCTVENNGSDGYPLGGAGLFIDDYEDSTASVVLTNCAIRNNYAYGNNSGGGIKLVGGDLLIIDCSILSNSAAWGGGFLVAHLADLKLHC